MRAFASIALLAAASAAGLGGCSPMTGSADMDGARPAERQCFDVDRVTNFRADQQRLYIEAANREVFELSTAGACNDMSSSFGIALEAQGGISSRLCTGESANLRIQSTTSPSQCRARVVRRLTAEEVAALPSHLRP